MKTVDHIMLSKLIVTVTARRRSWTSSMRDWFHINGIFCFQRINIRCFVPSESSWVQDRIHLNIISSFSKFLEALLKSKDASLDHKQTSLHLY